MKVIREKKKLIVMVVVIVLAVLIGVGVAVNATGSASGIAKSVTFSENMDGYYVYFRAVDEAGNAGDWSNSQRIWIDTKAPNVSAKEASVTIEEGTVENLEDYFNIEANGGNDDIDVVCTIGGVEYTDTESLTAEGSPYTVVCTASKNGGKSNKAEMELVVESSGWKGEIATSFARGSGSQADPYIIETPEQLAYLANSVNSGNNYYYKYFKQGADIDLGGKQAKDGTWSGQQWIPIGNSSESFQGHFDGNGYKISNIYINGSQDYQGLFGSTSSYRLENINIASGIIVGGDYIGGVVGITEEGSISNCTNNATVKGENYVGGICGRSR